MELVKIYQKLNDNDRQIQVLTSKKLRAYEMVLPKGLKYKEVMITSSLKNNDPMLDYLIITEQIDTELIKLTSERHQLKKDYLKELEKTTNLKDKSAIIKFYHKEVGLKYSDIDKILGFKPGKSKKIIWRKNHS